MRVTRLVLLAAALSLLLAAAAQAAAPVGALKQYRIPTANSQPRNIITGSDGNRWFTQGTEFFQSGQLARITPAGVVTEFPGVCDFCIVTDIAQGAGDVLYFVSNEPFIGRITTSGTLLDQIPMPNNNANSSNFAVDNANGAVWLADFNNDVIWRYDIAGGTFTSFPSSDPIDVAVAPDGDVWFSDNVDPGTIGHLDVQTNTITRTPVPSGAVAFQLTVATDGDVWFTERFSPQGVGRLDPATNAITEFPLTGVGPQGIAPGADGAVWFTQETKGNIARINDGGLSTYVETRAVKGSGPFGVTVDAAGDPWYTMLSANKIGEFQLK